MLGVSIILLIVACGELHAQQKRNVIFFLVDDLGQRDVGCYGSRFYETPAIDQLAKEGMLFDNAYATCHVCSPSRASILTGKYPARTNLTEWLGGRPERDYEKLHHGEKRIALPDDEQTLAETLHKHGYATANYGKAHLNKDPTTYGFDEAITGWVRSYYHPFSQTYSKTLPSKEGDYYTDKLTDAAIDFIKRHKDQPFFVHLEHFSVHDPIQGRKDLVKKYEKKLRTMPNQEGPDYILEPNPDGPALSEQELSALEEDDNITSHQDERVWWVKQKQDNVEFAGMVEATDESLARIRATLKELGLEKNTIIIFTADNGGMSASNQYRGIHHPRETLNERFASSNLPLRGAKGWNYEGGIRVPLIVYWPGMTHPGSTSQAIVTGTDYYPTLLEMLELPALPDQHRDGKSFVPALKAEDYKRGPVYWHFPHYSNHGYQSPNGAVRSGRYKLIEYYENGTVQLFDLENDIGEQHNLAASKPEVVRTLKTMLHDWRKAVDAKMPYPKTATSTPASGARVATSINNRLPAEVKKFAPGWEVRNWGGLAMKPGLRKTWHGRTNVLMTHPQSRDQPCVLSLQTDIPSGKKTTLCFAVTSHPKEDWKLCVRINGEVVLEKTITGVSWQECEVDLSSYAGRPVTIELENHANGWAVEAAYWNQLTLVQ